ncbi:glycine receptor subunit alphaZ1-like, partial [Nilaparvata lugens]|uniref:glycine receptor subunit alphaZ1-like n=1 Tax=Nilaparvata lugens TaxID=108931 RepID=UPI00193E7E80
NYSCLVAEFYLSRSVGFHLVQSYLPTILIVVISWVSFWMDVDSVPGRTTLGVTTLLAVSSQSSGIQSGLPQCRDTRSGDIAVRLQEVHRKAWGRTHDAGDGRTAKTPARREIDPAISTGFSTSPSGFAAGKHVRVLRVARVHVRELHVAQTVSGDLRKTLIHDGVNGEVITKGAPQLATEQQDEAVAVTVVKKVILTHGDLSGHVTNKNMIMARQIDEYSRLCFPLAFALFNVLYWSYYLA